MKRYNLLCERGFGLTLAMAKLDVYYINIDIVSQERPTVEFVQSEKLFLISTFPKCEKPMLRV